MADRLLKETEISLAYHLDNNLSSGDAYVVSTQFDWDRKTSTLERTLPFVGVKFFDSTNNWAYVDGASSYDPVYRFQLTCCADSHSNMRSLAGEVEQVLRTATATASGAFFRIENYPGLPLYDSEDNYREVGALEVDFPDGILDVFPADVSEYNNLKYASVLTVQLSTVYKDVTKDLL